MPNNYKTEIPQTLRQALDLACRAYMDYSQSEKNRDTWYSFTKLHGEKGRQNARAFRQKILTNKVTTEKILAETTAKYLLHCDNSSWRQHSFKSYILAGMHALECKTNIEDAYRQVEQMMQKDKLATETAKDLLSRYLLLFEIKLSNVITLNDTAIIIPH